MTFLNGFFLVNFLPFGIIILAGIWLFFKGKYKQEKWYWPLMFIVIVLTVISLWRMPVIFERRYALPTLIPGIIISVYLIMLLPNILKHFHVKFAVSIVRIAVTILLIFCVAKTLRFQESKPHLYEIPETLNKDMQRNNGKDAALLIFGNTGGHLIGLNDKVALIDINNRKFGDQLAELKCQFGILDKTSNVDILKIRYPRLYLLCVEEAPGAFSSAWRKCYGDQLELIYEYVKPKNYVCYRLYRSLSQYRKNVIWNSNTDVKLSGGISSVVADNNIKTYTVKGSKTIMSADFVPVEEGRIYQLSGEFRSVGPMPSRLYFGYAPYTKDKRFIRIEFVNYIMNTETELVKTCKSEDKILYVKNAENWNAHKYNMVVFDIDNTGNYADLPNFNLSSTGIQGIIKNKDFVKVELNNPCGKSYPVGTKVRVHQLRNYYIYNAAANALLENGEWKAFSNFIACPITGEKINLTDKLYPGTKFVKILMLANYGTENAVMEFKNIKIEDFKFVK